MSSRLSTRVISGATMNIAILLPTPRSTHTSPVVIGGYFIRFCSIVGRSASVPVMISPPANISAVPAMKLVLFNRSRFRNDRSSVVVVCTAKR